jgi:hypothetical protein
MTRYYGHHSGCALSLVLLGWLAWAIGVALFCILVVLAWLTWTAIALPAAGLAKACGRPELTGRLVRSAMPDLSWVGKRG